MIAYGTEVERSRPVILVVDRWPSYTVGETYAAWNYFRCKKYFRLYFKSAMHAISGISEQGKRARP
jgi:hypothetical protein